MTIPQGPGQTWIKSSYSANGACVEVRPTTVRTIAVRDSKASDGPHLGFDQASWNLFVQAVSTGSLDL
ncbi:DUF397 domain-containing protein [Streptomyces albus subsp. chlorinus]|uniref:DUF397 domain-containing protein n=1 Tax=Streptomyces albus TaxID=1888 RepID=UPI001570A973|nr:DUF397 domain-containing protein [Streptomyces albus]NSC22270.1 DUF397 domain-containing protein [Streptomyces albus subsp. chlorinus]